jgi:hypothetical protein
MAIPFAGASHIVGASSLAMETNDDMGNLTPRVVLGLIASKLAPTVVGSGFISLRRGTKIHAVYDARAHICLIGHSC